LFSIKELYIPPMYEGSLFPVSSPIFVIVDVAILTGGRWNLSVILICISFMARDGEHFFMCFLAVGLLPKKQFCSLLY
jgi:hypothetical protein